MKPLPIYAGTGYPQAYRHRLSLTRCHFMRVIVPRKRSAGNKPNANVAISHRASCVCSQAFQLKYKGLPLSIIGAQVLLLYTAKFSKPFLSQLSSIIYLPTGLEKAKRRCHRPLAQHISRPPRGNGPKSSKTAAHSTTDHQPRQ